MEIPETEIIFCDGEGKEILSTTLRPGDYVIGRNPDCNLQVEADLVSRRHAKLTIYFDHLTLEDLGSSNGTFVNGKQIHECTRLWPNQKVQIGSTTLEFSRIRTLPPPDVSLAPTTAAVRRLVPEEFLSEKKYDIGGVVAEGGMGAILDAREKTIDRIVAMKVMHPHWSPDDLTRFVAEAKINGRLEHPNIVPVYELGVDENNQVFYTMKFVKGVTLRAVLEQLASGDKETIRKFPLGVLLTIFQKVSDAIAFAHSKGVIHRDIKPENIMLGDFGEVLLMDWGLAKVLGEPQTKETPVERSMIHVQSDEAGLGSTLSGSVLGTPHFMPPEQARGEVETLDARADIYSLGATLYQILSLRRSVSGDTPMEVVEKVSRGAIDPLISPQKSRGEKFSVQGLAHLPGGQIPESLAAVVNKAMAFEKTARYASVSELQEDITSYQNGFATSAEQASFLKQALLMLKRHKAASIGIAAVILLTFGFTVKVIAEGKRAERGEAAAKATLSALRKTAPIFYAQAKVDFEDGKTKEAFEKIGYAIQLDQKNADYYLFRANLYESSQNLTKAIEDYRQVLALCPTDKVAQTNLALCEELRKEVPNQALGRPQQLKLLQSLRQQDRLIEAAPLAALLDPDTKTERATILARLREARNLPGWNDKRVTLLSDGTWEIALHYLAPIDFSVLKDEPISSLNLENTDISDLRSLAGLQLKSLNLGNNTKLTDLSPLKGMPLEHLSLYRVPVTDLSPLKGMKLNDLNIQGTQASDLSSLAGMKLHELIIWGSDVSDLTPLNGMPLTNLVILMAPHLTDLSPLNGAPLKSLTLHRTRVNDLTPLSNCPFLEKLTIGYSPISNLTPLTKLHLTELNCRYTGITDITPLRGQPLSKLGLEKTQVTDLSPLEGCATLEEIVLPDGAVDLSILRRLPNLKRISTTGFGSGVYSPTQTAEEFWKQYDQKAGAK